MLTTVIFFILSSNHNWPSFIFIVKRGKYDLILYQTSKVWPGPNWKQLKTIFVADPVENMMGKGENSSSKVVTDIFSFAPRLSKGFFTTGP